MKCKRLITAVVLFGIWFVIWLVLGGVAYAVIGIDGCITLGFLCLAAWAGCCYIAIDQIDATEVR